MATTATDKVQKPGDESKGPEAKGGPEAQAKPQKPQRGRPDDKLKIFCGTANEPLTDEICQFLGVNRGQAHIQRFSDGEV